MTVSFGGVSCRRNSSRIKWLELAYTRRFGKVFGHFCYVSWRQGARILYESASRQKRACAAGLEILGTHPIDAETSRDETHVGVGAESLGLCRFHIFLHARGFVCQALAPPLQCTNEMCTYHSTLFTSSHDLYPTVPASRNCESCPPAPLRGILTIHKAVFERCAPCQRYHGRSVEKASVEAICQPPIEGSRVAELHDHRTEARSGRWKNNWRIHAREIPP